MWISSSQSTTATGTVSYTHLDVYKRQDVFIAYLCHHRRDSDVGRTCAGTPLERGGAGVSGRIDHRAAVVTCVQYGLDGGGRRSRTQRAGGHSNQTTFGH